MILLSLLAFQNFCSVICINIQIFSETSSSQTNILHFIITWHLDKKTILHNEPKLNMLVPEHHYLRIIAFSNKASCLGIVIILLNIDVSESFLIVVTAIFQIQSLCYWVVPYCHLSIYKGEKVITIILFQKKRAIEHRFYRLLGGRGI